MVTEPEGPARTRALAVWTAAAAGGGASGWVLGGAISGGLGWEWVFAVNVPVGLAGVALAGRLLPESREPGAARLDVPGALALTAGVGAVLLGLSRGEADGLAAVATLIPLAAGLGLLALFAAIERRARAPLLPPGALRVPGLGRAALGALAITGTTSPAMFLCVLHVQRDGGLAPAEAGLLFAPLNLAVIAGSLAGPRVTARVGERAAMACGLAAIAAAAAWLAVAGATPGAALIATFGLMGGGLGVASVASTTMGTSRRRSARPRLRRAQHRGAARDRDRARAARRAGGGGRVRLGLGRRGGGRAGGRAGDRRQATSRSGARAPLARMSSSAATARAPGSSRACGSASGSA